jgi:predicted transcriptional regulator
MNDQPLPTIAYDPSAFGEPADAPLPMIEPELVELAATIDNPVIDEPLPSAAAEPATIEFVPAAVAPPLVPDEMAPAAAAAYAMAGDSELASHVSRPISSVMEQTLWTVHAEDSIERVEGILTEQELSSAPVVGSNGAVIGMIGAQELAQFHIDGKNAKAVQAWEIARIKLFEVSPGDSVEEVAKLMAENKLENMSVTECGRLKGIVSTRDLLQDMLNALPDESSRPA